MLEDVIGDHEVDRAVIQRQPSPRLNHLGISEKGVRQHGGVDVNANHLPGFAPQVEQIAMDRKQLVQIVATPGPEVEDDWIVKGAQQRVNARIELDGAVEPRIAPGEALGE
jgi:hypothetical protein